MQWSTEMGTITIRHGVQTVARDAFKAKLARHGTAIKRKAAAGHGPGAKRQNVHTFAAIREALSITQAHLHVGKQPVRGWHVEKLNCGNPEHWIVSVVPRMIHPFVM